MARFQRRFPVTPIVLGRVQLAASIAAAAPFVAPPQTVHVITSAQFPQRGHLSRDVDVIAPQRQAQASIVVAPRPVVLDQAPLARRQQRQARIILSQRQVLAAQQQVGSARPVVIRATTPRSQRRSLVVGPQRQSVAAAVQAAIVNPPRTTLVIEARPPRQYRHGGVTGPQRQSLAAAVQAAVFVGPPRPTIILARTPQQRHGVSRVIQSHPPAVFASPPRTVTVIDQAPFQRRRGQTRRVILSRPVIVTGNPPRTVTVIDQAPFQRRQRRASRIILPRRNYGLGAAVTPTLITTPATGYVSVGDVGPVASERTNLLAPSLVLAPSTFLAPGDIILASPSETAQAAAGSTGSLLVGDTGIVGQAYAPTDICTLGFGNQTLGTTDVAAMEALIGRSFHGIRLNVDVTANWNTTGGHITQFDLGRTASYRAFQLNPATDTYAQAIAGNFDTNFTSMVNNIVNSHRWTTTNPFILCFQHETTLGSNAPLGTAQNFIDAFRHYRLMLDSLGASVTSVTGAAVGGPIIMAYVGWDRMFTNGTVNSPPAGASYTDYDPDLGSSPAPAGTTYYTLVGSDVYNNIVSGSLQYGTVAATLLADIRAQAVARNKDWMIGEIAASDGATSQNHVDKAAWWDSIRTYIDGCGTTSPGVCRYMFTTIKTDASLYNIDSSAESTAAWQRLGFDSYYA